MVPLSATEPNIPRTDGGEPAIDLQGLRLCDPQGAPLVGPVDLQRPRGWQGALVGASGSGKSTLLLGIAGVVPPYEGRIVVCGEQPWRMSEAKRIVWRARHLGLVLQRVHLLPHLSVDHNLELAGHLAGLSRTETCRRAAAHLDHFGLAALGQRPAGSLSIGEQQRIAVIRALLHDPVVVLADEPTAALDPAAAAQVEATLREGCARLGATLLLVTHDPALAGRLPEVLRMVHGRLHAPEEAA
jgi:putative ABC transport system ATP-binding protein